MESDITQTDGQDIKIHATSLQELMQQPFSNAIFFLLKKRLPNDQEAAIFNACLVACIDHGVGNASSIATRYTASTKNTLNTSLAAGILALGEKHGGAVEKAMEQLMLPLEEVKQMIEEKKIIYGFGHKLYQVDPRVTWLEAFSKEHQFDLTFIEKARAVEALLEQIKQKRLCLNIDGMLAALLLSMHFSPKEARAVFMIARTPGLCAHALEEETAGKVRRA